MPKKRAHNPAPYKAADSGIRISKSSPALPAAELLSFLKQTRASQPWTEHDIAKALKIGSPEAKQAVAVLQLQGYIEPVGRTEKWRMTAQGELVSGAKPPRFTRTSVETALASLRDRIKAVNDDRDAPYEITEAVAFGDFLTDAVRLQAADVGIRFQAKADAQSIPSAKEHATELDFLKQLRGQAGVLHVMPYEDWMSMRSHVQLI